MSGIRRCWWLIGVAFLLLAPAAMAAESAHDFIGSNNCKKCHIKQFKSWEQTAMAQAFESLKPGVKADEKKAIEALKKCSSDSRFRKDASGKPAKLYWNATGANLAEKFKEIADELSNLRIVG